MACNAILRPDGTINEVSLNEALLDIDFKETFDILKAKTDEVVALKLIGINGGYAFTLDRNGNPSKFIQSALDKGFSLSDAILFKAKMYSNKYNSILESGEPTIDELSGLSEKPIKTTFNGYRGNEYIEHLFNAKQSEDYIVDTDKHLSATIGLTNEAEHKRIQSGVDLLHRIMNKIYHDRDIALDALRDTLGRNVTKDDIIEANLDIGLVDLIGITKSTLEHYISVLERNDDNFSTIQAVALANDIIRELDKYLITAKLNNKESTLQSAILNNDTSIFAAALNSYIITYKRNDIAEDLSEDEEGAFMKALFDKFDASNSTTSNLDPVLYEHLSVVPLYDFNEHGEPVLVYDPRNGLPKTVNPAILVAMLKTKVADKMSQLDFYLELERLAKYNPTISALLEVFRNSPYKDTLSNLLYFNLQSVRPAMIVNRLNVKGRNNVEVNTTIANLPRAYRIQTETVNTVKSNLIKGTYTNLTKILDNLTTATGINRRQYFIQYLDELGLKLLNSDRYAILNGAADEFLLNLSTLSGINKAITILSEAYSKVDLTKTLDVTDLFQIKLSKVANAQKGVLLFQLRQLSQVIDKIRIDLSEETFINVNNTQEYSLRIAGFIEKLQADFKSNTMSDRAKERLMEYAKSGVLKVIPQLRDVDLGLIANGNLALLDIAYKALHDIVKENYAGAKNNRQVGSKYEEETEHDFLFDIAVAFYAQDSNYNKSNQTVRRVPGVIQSDSGQFTFYKVPTIADFTFNGLTVNLDGRFIFDKNLPLGENAYFASILNLVQVEFEQMLKARDYMFENTNGVYNLKDGIEPELISNAFHVKGEVFKNGKVAGRIFKFHTITGLQERLEQIEGFFDSRGIIQLDNFNLIELFKENTNLIGKEKAKKVRDAILDSINEHISNEQLALLENFEPVKDKLAPTLAKNLLTESELADYKFDKRTLDKDKVLSRFLFDYTIHTMVYNGVQQYLFQGTTAFYKNSDDTTKRAKQVVSNSRRLGQAGIINRNNPERADKLPVALLADVVITPKGIKEVISEISDKAKQKELQDYYKNIEAGDGQGWITPHGYANYLIGKGDIKMLNQFFKFNTKDQVWELREDVPLDMAVDLLKPIKPFYYEYRYNEELNMMHPFQIKPSFTLLHPKFLKNRELGLLLKKLNKQGVEIAVMESAIKDGAHRVNDLRTKDKTRFNKNLLKGNAALQVIELNRDFLGDQVTVVNHHKDTSIKAGIQIFKHIDTMVADDDTLEYKGQTVTGKWIKEHYHKLVSHLVEQGGYKVMRTIDNILDNPPALAKLLKDRAGNQATADLDYILEVDETGNFKRPIELFGSAQFQSLITSLFTKEVTNVKVPGLHNVMLSNFGMGNIFTTEDESILASSEYNALVDANGNLTDPKNLKVIKDGDRVIYQAMIVPWSKDFYDANGNLIPINKLSPELRTMIAYRIPTSAPHSAVTIEIVGWLPEDMGSVIVLPDEVVARTGADFDIDTLYINRKVHRKTYIDNKAYFEEEHLIDWQNVQFSVADMLNHNLDADGQYYLQTLRQIYKKLNTAIEYAKDEDYINQLQEVKQLLESFFDTKQENKIINENLHEQLRTINNRFKELAELDISKESKEALHKYFFEQRSIANAAIAGYRKQIATVNERLADIVDTFEELNQQGLYDDVLKHEYYELVEKRDELRQNRDNVISQLEDMRARFEEQLGRFTPYEMAKAEQQQLFDSKNEQVQQLINEKQALLTDIFTKFAELNTLDVQPTNAVYSDLVDVFDSFLQNKNNLYRNHKPAAFNFLEDVAKESRTEEDRNPINLSTQLYFRRSALTGKTVLPIAANTATGFAELSKVKARLSNTVKLTYTVEELKERTGIKNREELVKMLEARYELTFNSDKYITIAFNKIGWTADGSGLNIDGRPLLDELGAWIDYAADAVKNKLPTGLTANLFSTIVGLGVTGDMQYGVRLVNTLAAKIINDWHEYNKSLHAPDKVNVTTQAITTFVHKIVKEISVANAVYKIYDQLKTRLNQLDVSYFNSKEQQAWLVDNFGEEIANNIDDIFRQANEFIQAKEPTEEQIKAAAIFDNIYVALNNSNENQLLSMNTIVRTNIKPILNNAEYKGIVNIFKTFRVKQPIKLEDYLGFLEKKYINNIKTAFTDFAAGKTDHPVLWKSTIKAISKHISNNPSRNPTAEQLKEVVNISNNIYFEPVHNRLDNYLTQISLVESIDKFSKLGNDLTKVIILLNYDKFGAGKSFAENFELYNQLEKILAQERLNMEKEDEARPVPKIYVQDETSNEIYDVLYYVYEQGGNKILQSYYEYSNKLSRAFITQLPKMGAFKYSYANTKFAHYSDAMLDYFGIKGKDLRKTVVNKLSANLYYKHLVLGDNDFYKLDDETIDNLLGINKSAVFTIDKNMPLSEFRELSVAQQLAVVKEILNDEIDEYHILAYLSPNLDLFNIQKYNFHNIEVANINNKDVFLDSVRNSHLTMLNHSDERVRLLAENLIRYNVARFGLQTGANSFSNLFSPALYNLPEYHINNNYDVIKDYAVLDEQTADLQLDEMRDAIRTAEQESYALTQRLFLDLDTIYNQSLINDAMSLHQYLPTYTWDTTIDEYSDGLTIDVKDNPIMAKIAQAKHGDIIEFYQSYLKSDNKSKPFIFYKLSTLLQGKVSNFVKLYNPITDSYKLLVIGGTSFKVLDFQPNNIDMRTNMHTKSNQTIELTKQAIVQSLKEQAVNSPENNNCKGA